MKKLVILISGRGSNMVSIVEACRARGWPASVVGVIANRPEAPGLQTARQLGLATAVVDHKAWPDRAAFEAVLARQLDDWEADLIILAGFMRVLTADFVQRFAGRIVNIHPSLLPAFPGLDTHQQALKAGVCVHGATVHGVTPALDDGPIFAQAAVPVLAADTPETLAARVLREEHRLYPRVIEWLVADRVQHRSGRVWVEGVEDSARLIWSALP